MSELKERDARELILNNHYWPNEESLRVYLKSEADKVIAELEESHKMEVEQLLIEIAELKEEIERLKQENEMNFVGMNLHSPTSDGRFI